MIGDRIPSFMEELEKIGVSYHLSSFLKSRSGKRPIRVHKLLEKERAFKMPEVDVENLKPYAREEGGGMMLEETQ